MKEINGNHAQSGMEEKSGPQMARSQPADSTPVVRSKADSRYWLIGNRLTFHGSANYSARLQFRGRREWFPLGTPNKKKAATKAAEIYAHIQREGFDAAIAHFKREADGKVAEATVGALIQSATEFSSARPQTLEEYSKAFRKITSEIKGITLTDRTPSGIDAWRKKVDKVKLSDLTPSAVMAWKSTRMRRAADAADADNLTKRHTAVTVNSLIRNAKALFGRKLRPFLELRIELPAPLPFEGVVMEKTPSLRYASRIDPYAILAKAKQDLAEQEPEAFKVMVLALVGGLRRSEIDNLLWRSVEFPRKVIRVESTEYHQLKSEDSAGEIDLNDDILAVFRRYRESHPTDLFVIRSRNRPQIETKTRGYRCNATFKKVLSWLRDQGVEDSKPLHTLRKEIGSLIASEHGIFEASRYLRHSDIRITSAFYADKKKVVTPMAFSGLLGPAESSEKPNPHQDANG